MEFIGLARALIWVLLPAPTGKTARQRSSCLLSAGKRFLSIDGWAPLSRKEVQCPPHPGKSRKILYIREHFSDWGYAGWGESSVESISEATGLRETEFGNWKSIFSQEYTLAWLSCMSTMASSVLMTAAVASTWEEEENPGIPTPPHKESSIMCESLPDPCLGVKFIAWTQNSQSSSKSKTTLWPEQEAKT